METSMQMKTIRRIILSPPSGLYLRSCDVERLKIGVGEGKADAVLPCFKSKIQRKIPMKIYFPTQLNGVQALYNVTYKISVQCAFT
jgi:hypothetical protein